MEQENDQQEVLNPDEKSELEQESENAEGEESIEVLKEKLLKAEELAKNQKIRAEKAEATAKLLKQKPKVEEQPKKSEYSLQDIRALSDVHDEDVEEVVEFAKFKGIAIAEAKKNPTIQNLLKAKEEERKTAQATNTSGGRRASTQETGESLLEKVSQGQVPDTDEGIRKLAEARIEARKKNLK